MRFGYILGCVCLAACGSAGGGGDTVSRADQAALLAEDLLASNISNPQTLPDDGTASYSGFMTAGLPTGNDGARVDYLGDFDMTVDFSADRNQITGRARNFQSAGGAALAGTLRLRGGDLFRDTDPDDNYTFTGNVDGQLSRNGNDYQIDAEIAGEFRGRRQNGVSGLLFGDVTGPDGQDIFDGDFVAEKD